MNEAVAQLFVQVQIDPQAPAVVQHEVPRSITTPRQHAVDTDSGEGDDQRVKIGGR
ncbi:hypothetical protein OHU19_02315 [Streptomyces sp. NBC_00145]